MNGGEPDGVEKYIPSVFVPQLTTEVLAKYGHFGLLNRPHSVVEFFRDPALRAHVTEEYVLVAETDRTFYVKEERLAALTATALGIATDSACGRRLQGWLDPARSGGGDAMHATAAEYMAIAAAVYHLARAPAPRDSPKTSTPSRMAAPTIHG